MGLITPDFPVGLFHPVCPARIHPPRGHLEIVPKHYSNRVLSLPKILSWLPLASCMKHSFL